MWYRHPQASDASYRRSQRLILLVHDDSSRSAASEMQSRASRPMTMSTICCRHKRATAVLSTKQPTSRSKTLAVHLLRRDQFLAPRQHLEGLSHYRPPQPPVFAIDEHSSCIRREAATSVLVVRNPASGSDARRLGEVLHVRMTHRSAQRCLTRRRAGTRSRRAIRLADFDPGHQTRLSSARATRRSKLSTLTFRPPTSSCSLAGCDVDSSPRCATSIRVGRGPSACAWPGLA